LDALRDYDKDKTLKAMMGEEFSSAYPEAEAARNGTPTCRISRLGNPDTLDI
jgi:hypothetical protein